MSVKIELKESAYNRFIELLGGQQYLENLKYYLSEQGNGVTIDSACHTGNCGIALALGKNDYNNSYKNQKKSVVKRESIKMRILDSLSNAIYKTAEKVENISDEEKVHNANEAISLILNKDSTIVAYDNPETASKEMLKDHRVTH